MKIVSVVGARSEFVQSVPVSRALRADGRHQEVLVNVGSPHDYVMMQSFLAGMAGPEPDYNLEAGSGSQAAQTGAILTSMEQVLFRERPDLVLVRGATDSAIGAALAAAKLRIPVAHVAAGERSCDHCPSGEINSLVTDSLSDLHLCIRFAAIKWLALKGITQSVHWIGDAALDTLLQYRPLAYLKSKILQGLELSAGKYALVMLHQLCQSSCGERLQQIITALNALDETIVLPLDVQTRTLVKRHGLQLGSHVRVIDSLRYLDMIMLADNARLIATDSGATQREAYFLGVPCITFQDETEWMETVWVGWNLLVGTDPERIADSWFTFSPPSAHPPVYGDGRAAGRLAEIVSKVDLGRTNVMRPKRRPIDVSRPTYHSLAFQHAVHER